MAWLRYAALLAVSIAISVSGLVYLDVAATEENEYLSFLVAVFIVFGSVIGAAAMATVMHKWFTDTALPRNVAVPTQYGDVFSRYVTRFRMDHCPYCKWLWDFAGSRATVISMAHKLQ